MLAVDAAAPSDVHRLSIHPHCPLSAKPFVTHSPDNSGNMVLLTAEPALSPTVCVFFCQLSSSSSLSLLLLCVCALCMLACGGQRMSGSVMESRAY